MAKALWKGYMTLGQLGIPVRLFSATQAIRPRFVLLHEEDGSPVGRELCCQAEQRTIPSSETVRAIEHAPGQYITLTNRELELSTGDDIKTIAVRQFCNPESVSSVYYEKPYYIVPTRGGERAYALLREVLVRLRRAAIAEFVIHGKQHIATLERFGDLLILQQLRYEAELVPRSSISTPALPKPSPAEIDALSTVIEHLSGPFYPGDYHDEHTEHIVKLIERKTRHLPPPRAERIAPHATPESEIVSALMNSFGGDALDSLRIHDRGRPEDPKAL